MNRWNLREAVSVKKQSIANYGFKHIMFLSCFLLFVLDFSIKTKAMNISNLNPKYTIWLVFKSNWGDQLGPSLFKINKNKQHLLNHVYLDIV